MGEAEEFLAETEAILRERIEKYQAQEFERTGVVPDCRITTESRSIFLVLPLNPHEEMSRSYDD